jgi:hypothetical protein
VLELCADEVATYRSAPADGLKKAVCWYSAGHEIFDYFSAMASGGYFGHRAIVSQ